MCAASDPHFGHDPGWSILQQFGQKGKAGKKALLLKSIVLSLVAAGLAMALQLSGILGVMAGAWEISVVIVAGLVWLRTGRDPILHLVRVLLLVRSGLIVLGCMIPEGMSIWIVETRRHFENAQRTTGCIQ